MSATPPPSTLLMGAAGSGKTTSIATLLAAGKEVFLLATERASINRVLLRCKELNIPTEKFRYHYLSPKRTGFSALIDASTMLKNWGVDEIAKKAAANRANDSFNTLMQCFIDFPDDATGQKFGDVTTWGAERALVVDSLTGLNSMARQMVVGTKPNPHPGEWGAMQQMVLATIEELINNCYCYLVVIAHIERNYDETTGLRSITVSVPGQKLAPKILPIFTNVILAARDGQKFRWSTIEESHDLKAGDLTFSRDLAPTFQLVIDAHERTQKELTDAV